MRKSFLLALVALCSLIGGTAAAIADSDASENALHMQWADRSEVVHVFVFADEGRPGQPPALIPGKAPIRFGFEWSGNSVAELQDFVDDPGNDVLMSTDGGPWISIKSGYQTPFVAVAGEGPRWSWDHDGDGLGDGNGNGIGDWDGPTLFWRYTVAHLDKGTHTFDLQVTQDGGTVTLEDRITAIVG